MVSFKIKEVLMIIRFGWVSEKNKEKEEEEEEEEEE